MNWLSLVQLSLLLLNTIFITTSIQKFNSVNDEPITLLTFASRKRGIMQLPGYFGSLMNNTASSRLDVHFITDNEGYSLIHDCLPALRSRLFNVTLKNLNWPQFTNHIVLEHYDKYFKTGVANPHWKDNNYFQRYHVAIYKLDVVNILPRNIHRAILLDIDLLMLEDLSNLWSEADINPNKYLYMAPENYQNDSYFTNPKQYGNRKIHFYQPYGINSGVVIANLDLMRQDNLTATKLIEINDEYPRIPDQDIFNTWGYYNPDKIGLLPCRWNTRGYIYCFEKNITFDRSRSDRGIFHGNNRKGTSPFTMEPTPEYALEQGLHRDYSNDFYKLCHVTQDRMNHLVKLAVQAEAKLGQK